MMPHPRTVFLLALAGIGFLFLLVGIGVWASVRAGNYQIKSHPLSDLTRKAGDNRRKSDRILEDVSIPPLILPEVFQAKVKQTDVNSSLEKRILAVEVESSEFALNGTEPTNTPEPITTVETTSSTVPSTSVRPPRIRTKTKGSKAKTETESWVPGVKKFIPPQEALQITESDAVGTAGIATNGVVVPVKINANDAMMSPNAPVRSRKISLPSKNIDSGSLEDAISEVEVSWEQNRRKSAEVTSRESGQVQLFRAAQAAAVINLMAQSAFAANAPSNEFENVESENKRIKDASFTSATKIYSVNTEGPFTNFKKQYPPPLQGNIATGSNQRYHITEKAVSQNPERKPQTTGITINNNLISATESNSVPSLYNRAVIRTGMLQEDISETVDPLDSLADVQVEALEDFLNDVMAGKDSLDRLTFVMKMMNITSVSPEYIRNIFMEFRDEQEGAIPAVQPRPPIKPLHLPPLLPPPMASGQRRPPQFGRIDHSADEENRQVNPVSTLGLLGLGVLLLNKVKSAVSQTPVEIARYSSDRLLLQPSTDPRNENFTSDKRSLEDFSFLLRQTLLSNNVSIDVVDMNGDRVKPLDCLQRLFCENIKAFRQPDEKYSMDSSRSIGLVDSTVSLTKSEVLHFVEQIPANRLEGCSSYDSRCSVSTAKRIVSSLFLQQSSILRKKDNRQAY